MNGRLFRLLLTLPGALLIACSPMVEAAQVTISARYQGGTDGHFENTTPPAPFCSGWLGTCEDMETVGVPISFAKTSIYRAPDARDQFYMKVPGTRKVQVVHQGTGESHEVSFEITAFAQAYQVRSEDYSPASGTDVKGGCQFVTGELAEPDFQFGAYLWSVRNPSSPQPCYSSATYGSVGDVRVTDFTDFGISYRLFLPPPRRLGQGLYRGSVTFRIGPGGDFDFGNQVSDLSSDTLVVDFELDVQHAFVLQFPAGSDIAVLEPPGGWNAWLGGRGAPRRLYRDVPMRMWSTGPFKVYKRCQYTLAGACAIRNPAGVQAPVEVSLSLPEGVVHSGQPVRRLAIPTGPGAALRFEHLTIVSDRPGRLHFEAASSAVQTMLSQPGTRFAGEVTVVFDAEL
ncbi:hypothetical protein [Pseudomonas shirazensis]|uniref:hypothetical protein n=1 Tax=Pseudomonas shirazensis TaxID=2745494 RepID=UPI003D2AC4AA